ncbi:hypothetical protein Ahy_B06g085355 isoform I [Arachis hypogaea]|uniref:AMP-dependent synthetase/ligase domain-containing protein n=1 Tax=Arachis hypogaea TaxID=3818 RepID=A0A444YU89_ARAHY|nr:hypothetical protein Ahy_B06g085355 isoform I [Arachis hypogaea]
MPAFITRRVETRDRVTVTERGKEHISRASSSPTTEKTRRPLSESRASSSSPPLPSPLPRHPLHAGKYKWQTYKEVYEVIQKVGSSIHSCGYGQGMKCGIYGANCPGWIISMEACNAHGLYYVPLYDTLGAGAVEFIICHAEISIAFVEEKKIPELLKTFPNASKFLKTLVSFEKFTPEQKQQVENFGVKSYSWDEFLQVVKFVADTNWRPYLATRRNTILTASSKVLPPPSEVVGASASPSFPLSRTQALSPSSARRPHPRWLLCSRLGAARRRVAPRPSTLAVVSPLAILLHKGLTGQLKIEGFSDLFMQ